MRTEHSQRLTNLRFADEIILLGSSLSHIKSMLDQVENACAAVGLALHPDKSMIMHNRLGTGQHPDEIYIGGGKIAIKPCSFSTNYLGQALSLTEFQTGAVESRMCKAWAQFWKYQEELTNKVQPLQTRLKLFNSVASSSAMYGCESWTMTSTTTQLLKTTQRKMMRMILGLPWHNGPEDDTKADVDWIRKCMHKAEEAPLAATIPGWVETQRQRQWRAAKKLASHTSSQWAFHALTSPLSTSRRPGRPKKRWQDDITHFLKQHWDPQFTWTSILCPPMLGILKKIKEQLHLRELEAQWCY